MGDLFQVGPVIYVKVSVRGELVSGWTCHLFKSIAATWGTCFKFDCPSSKIISDIGNLLQVGPVYLVIVLVTWETSFMLFLPFSKSISDMGYLFQIGTVIYIKVSVT